MQPILVADMAETNARARRKAGRRRRSTRIKEGVSAGVRGFEESKACKGLFLTQETFADLYGKLAVFSGKPLLKAVRIDSAGMCWFKLFGFELFEP